MAETRQIAWECEPDVYGYAAGIVNGGNLLAEATVTPRPDGSAVYDVIGQDGITIFATGVAGSVADAKKAAEAGMRRVVVQLA